MATRPSKIWLYRLLLKASQTSSKHGFTLIELLVAIIISALVVTGLLFLVVEMLQLDRREFVLNQTQQDMQRSLAYITNDLEEAVYVYSTPTAVTDNLNFAADEVPVLAFWRPDPLSASEEAELNASACATDECEVLRIRRYTFSLVVYLLKPNQAGDVWDGQSRIVRYELPKYTGIDPLTSTTGYVDPSLPGSSFANWVPDLNPDGRAAVLTDYVDASTVTLTNLQTCDDFGTNYSRSPASATSFFSCIQDNAATLGNVNQEVFVFLRGNALDGRPGLINEQNEGSDNPTLQSRVQVRGVLDKQ
ncbi:MAG: prepilin-type N-terminal cleavage/methylation domain-containing protein [Cyanobacteria bacterium J06635_15]